MPICPPFAAAVALAFLAALPVAAQDETPLALPATPEPAECRVEPRPVAFFRDAIRQAVASPSVIVRGADTTPIPIPVPEGAGQPAADATVAAVTATVREAYACTNAGDSRRLYALFTDRAARDAVALFVSFGISSLRLAEDGAATPGTAEAEIVREL